MDIRKAFGFQLEDKRWLNKLGLAAAVAAVPILNLAFSGYVIDVLRNVARGSSEPLPEWDDLGKRFVEGAILLAATFVYALPGLLVICLPTSLIVLSGALSGSQNLQSLESTIRSAGGALFYCLLCVLLLYVLLLSIVHPAITILFSRQCTFASCFKIREALQMVRRDVSGFFTAWLGYVVATIVVALVVGLIGALTGWIPCIGWAVGLVLSLGSLVYLGTVYAHLFGQFAQATSGGNRGSSSS